MAERQKVSGNVWAREALKKLVILEYLNGQTAVQLKALKEGLLRHGGIGVKQALRSVKRDKR